MVTGENKNVGSFSAAIKKNLGKSCRWCGLVFRWRYANKSQPSGEDFAKERQILIISCRWKYEKSGLHPGRWKESPGAMWGQLTNSALHSLQLLGNPVANNLGEELQNKTTMESFTLLCCLLNFLGTFWRAWQVGVVQYFVLMLPYILELFLFKFFLSFKHVGSYILPRWSSMSYSRHNTSNLKTLESTGAS